MDQPGVVVNLSSLSDMKRFATLALIALAALPAATLSQQQTIPPAAPTIGASGGFGGGITIPIGRLNDTHAAGYTLAGLVDFSAADQPYSFRLELVHQHFDRKTSAPAAVKAMNMTSLGASLLARSAQKNASSGFVIGGIAVYKMTDEGTKPGLNAGIGLEVPLTFFIGIADIRVHYVLSEGKPGVTIPITLGARL
jgi:hypothetical protein